MSSWEQYFKVHTARAPRPEVVKAVAYCATKNHALDLGAGTLVDSKFLLETGFVKVDAVESAPEVLDIAKEIADPRFTLYHTSFQDFVFISNTYDFISAQYALPFHGPKDFSQFIEKIKDSLVPGGIFAGQLFGVNDGWNTPGAQHAFQTRDEALAFFADMETILFEEKEYESGTASGKQKHWHIFEFIVRKK